MCGGGDTPTRRSCLQWSEQQGGWATLPVTLTEERWGSSVWGTEEGLVIMGGWSDGAEQTSETVSSDGTNSVTTFRMERPTR